MKTFFYFHTYSDLGLHFQPNDASRVYNLQIHIINISIKSLSEWPERETKYLECRSDCRHRNSKIKLYRKNRLGSDFCVLVNRSFIDIYSILVFLPIFYCFQIHFEFYLLFLSLPEDWMRNSSETPTQVFVIVLKLDCGIE